MHTSRVVALVGALIVAQACTRTVYVPISSGPQPSNPQPVPQPAPQPEPPRERPQPATAATLGIPAGHLPDVGECRVWTPGTPPGRQRYERSRSCHDIGSVAPGGSWIVYRPSRDRRLVHVRVTDRQRPGKILVVHVFEAETGRFLRDEAYEELARSQPQPVPTAAPRRQPQQAPNPTLDPGTDRTMPVPPPPPMTPRTDPAPTDPVQSGPDRRKPTTAPAGVPTGDLPTFVPTSAPGAPTKPERTPTTAPAGVPAGDLPTFVPTAVPDVAPTKPEPRSGPAPAPTPTPIPAPTGGPAPAPTTAPLDIPPGHMPDPGQCRIWIPGTPPGRQPHKASAECDRITNEAPAGSWVVSRPTKDRKAVYVRVVDARRAGVIVAVRVYDENGKFVREEQP